MSTVKIAQYGGTCPLCSVAYKVTARIARTPMGWAHENCAAEWRSRRTGTLVASGTSPRPYLR